MWQENVLCMSKISENVANDWFVTLAGTPFSQVLSASGGHGFMKCLVNPPIEVQLLTPSTGKQLLLHSIIDKVSATYIV